MRAKLVRFMAADLASCIIELNGIKFNHWTYACKAGRTARPKSKQSQAKPSQAKPSQARPSQEEQRMYHAIVRRRIRALFAAINRGDAEPVLASFARRFEHAFLGEHALGGARHTLPAT